MPGFGSAVENRKEIKRPRNTPFGFTRVIADYSLPQFRGEGEEEEMENLVYLKESVARIMAGNGQFGDIISQWHRGFHRRLAEEFGSKSDPYGDWDEKMFSFQETLVSEGYLEEDWDGTEDGYGNPVLRWRLGPHFARPHWIGGDREVWIEAVCEHRFDPPGPNDVPQWAVRVSDTGDPDGKSWWLCVCKDAEEANEKARQARDLLKEYGADWGFIIPLFGDE